MSRRVLVLGLGVSTTPVAFHALEAGDAVTVYAGERTDVTAERARELEQRGAKVVFDTQDVEGSYDVCVPSPGISQFSDFYQSAAEHSERLVSDIEYAWELDPQRWVAVTGTNGKTTTTALTAHLLSASGMPAHPCGNIGTAAVEAQTAHKAGEWLVAEVSSYMLASTVDFAPNVAVLLNITPDHLHWHRSHEAYAAAKLKVFANLREGATAVVGANVPGREELEAQLASRGVQVVFLGGKREGSCAYLGEDGLLHANLSGRDYALVAPSEMKIKGTHNIENALAAASAALACGADAGLVCAGLRSFEALEHRIEPCGEVGGVGFYNDSKATNVDATLQALTAFEGRKIVLLLGGRDKGTDLSELVDACDGPVRDVVVYGEARERFAAAFADAAVPCHEAQGMRAAFKLACRIADAGDAVLLSPACASFDEFNSFEHRGAVFKELVLAHQAH